MESISTFIITLVTTLILMTAVELISPNNSIKKYISFVLGLILISVMLTPIVSFFSKGETEIAKEISRYGNDLKSTIKAEDETKVDTKRNEKFKKNLEKNSEKLLEEKFKGKEFVSDISCNMDLKNMTYSIEKIEIGVKDGSVRKIQKVEIQGNETSEVIANENETNPEEEEMKNYLEEVFNVKAENIKIYKLE